MTHNRSIKKNSISLKNRLTLTYALFISAALAVLTVVINLCTGFIFTGLIKENIAQKSAEITSTIGGQYNSGSMGFDAAVVEAVGMYFVHSGYIVTVEDDRGNIIWDARSCDMRECMEVISDITARMERQFKINGAMRKEQYPVMYGSRAVGTVTIETYGPYFYSETESRFLGSINRLLGIAGIVLILFSIVISGILSKTIAQPVLAAAEAARRIAEAYTGGPKPEIPAIDIPALNMPDRYATRELAELSRSINELAAELNEAAFRQKQLTSDVAHELRTPLTCLRGSIEAMLDGVYAPDRSRLESCHEEIVRLSGMVDDLHTLSGLEWENITLNKTPFDLAELVRLTLTQFRAAADKKNIALVEDLHTSPITADYDRLKQVFINLLSNAVKYTDSGSITVTVRETEVCIADTGIGIPEADLPRVFERFYRSDKSRSRSTGGSGIGLAIAAAIVHAHGGTITAETRPGGGSVFRVRFGPGSFASLFK